MRMQVQEQRETERKSVKVADKGMKEATLAWHASTREMCMRKCRCKSNVRWRERERECIEATHSVREATLSWNNSALPRSYLRTRVEIMFSSAVSQLCKHVFSFFFFFFKFFFRMAKENKDIYATKAENKKVSGTGYYPAVWNGT